MTTTKTDTGSEAYKLRCLARHYWRHYPERVKRHEALERYQARHGVEASKRLKTLMAEEKALCEGWCTSNGHSFAYGWFMRFLAIPPALGVSRA